MGVGGQRHAPAVLQPGMTRYPLYMRPGIPQGRSGRVLKISLPPGLDPRTVQLVTSRYTGYAIPAHTVSRVRNIRHSTKLALDCAKVRNSRIGLAPLCFTQISYP
jgi:hypothetical protein